MRTIKIGIRKDKTMVKIVTDSSTLYTQEQAKELGFRATPLSISIDTWDGLDLEMDMNKFYAKIEEGHNPRSSQPSIGLVIDAFEEFKDDEIINIAMADGLSGTYQSACSAQTMVKHQDNITVVNSTTLCGPHRYMVDQAKIMADKGVSREKIVQWLESVTEHVDSYLIPQDFGFLRRGGRLTPVAAAFGGVLRLKPIVKTTEDGKRLDKFATKRSLESAIDSVIKNMEKMGVDENYILFISHANVLEDAKMAEAMFTKAFPKVELRMHDLSPAFVTQGGPGCIALQYVKKKPIVE